MSPLNEKRIPRDPEQAPYRVNHPTRKAEMKSMRDFKKKRTDLVTNITPPPTTLTRLA